MINLQLTPTEHNLLLQALMDYAITSKSLLKSEKELYWNMIESIAVSMLFTPQNINRLYRALIAYITKYIYEDTNAMIQLSKKLLIYMNEVYKKWYLLIWA